jgi:pilus assembly protein Flp/PilA
MLDQVKDFWRDESGATAIEYGLIAGLIAVVIIAALTDIGTNLKGIFETISSKVQSANTSAS